MLPRAMAVVFLLGVNLLLADQALGITNEGNEFFLLVPPVKSQAQNQFIPQLHITTSEDTNVMFTVSHNAASHRLSAFNQTFTASKGSVTKVNLPTGLRAFTTSPANLDIAVNVKAEDGKTIVVYLLNEDAASTDIALLYPKFATKTNTYTYYAVSSPKADPELGEGERSFVGIIPTEDNCVVEVTPTASAFGFIFGVATRDHRPGVVAKSRALPKNTVIFLSSEDDLTGTKVTGTCYLSVITGHQCAFYPADVQSCDGIMEQIPPTETWGFNFFLSPLAKRQSAGYRFIAGADNTVVTRRCNGAEPDTFNLTSAGNFREVLVNMPTYCHVESNQPLLVAQYSLGQQFSGSSDGFADPFVTLIVPVGQFNYKYNFVLVESVTPQDVAQPVVFDPYLNLVVTSECCRRNEILYDGQPLPSSVSFTDIACTGGEVCGCAAQFHPSISTGAHTLMHSRDSCGIGATLYAWQDQNSYGSMAGTRLDSIAATNFCFRDGTITACPVGDNVARFTLTRTGVVSNEGCVSLEATDGTAESGTDFRITDTSCCFAANQRVTECESIQLLDGAREGRTFSVRLVAGSGDCVCNETLEITIGCPPVFALEREEYFVNETAGVARIGVVKKSGSIDAGQSITVVVMPTDGTGPNQDAVPATAGPDYSSDAVNAVFGPSDTTVFVEIPISNDGILEKLEYFNVAANLGAGAPSDARIVSPDMATVFIMDANTISFEQASYETVESVGNFRDVRLVSSQPFAEDTDVTISFTDISATGGADISAAGVDYGDNTVVVTFTAGESVSSNATIPIADDGPGGEGTEQFRASFELPTEYPGLQRGTPSEAVVSIVEDAVISVGFDPTEYRVDEDGSSVRLRLVADLASPTPYSVNISLTDSDAIFTEDYGTASGSRQVIATFPAGATEAFVNVDIIDNFFPEEDEQFKAIISGISIPDSVQVGANSEATVTILDNEPEISVSFSPVVYNYSEADGVATLTLVASTPAQVDYDVYVDTRDGTALSPDDYTGGRYTATFAAGSTSAQVNIPIDDGCFDGLGAETFFGDLVISADAMAKGVRAGPGTLATVNVEDNEPAPVVNFDPTTYEVLESAGILTSMIVSSAPACEDYDVTVATRDGSATSPSDYMGGQADFTFKAGETKVSINITIEDDDLFEGDEIFYCNLTLPSATSARGIQLGSDDEATATIRDDEPGVRVTFAPTSYTVSEDAGNVTLMLVASGPSSEAYSVFVNTRDGSATSTDDYTGGRYEAIFAAGSTMATVVVPIVDDRCYDGPDNEMFFGDLEVPSAAMEKGVAAGSDRVATINIMDSQPAPVVNFDPTMYEVMESAGYLTSMLVSSGPACEDYDVTVSTRDGSATSPTDYTGGQGDFTFKAGETKVSINVSIEDDGLFEGDETFHGDLTLPNATIARGIQLGSDDEATATIRDDEPGITVNFAPTSYTVSEDAASVTLMLVASGPSSEAYSVFVNTRDGSATSTDDYTGGRYEAVFAAGSTMATVVVPIEPDGCYDGPDNEMFFGELEVPSAAIEKGVAAGSERVATVNITDSQPAPVVNFDPTMYEVLESAGYLTSMLVSSGPACEDYDVTVATRDGSATSPADFIGGQADFTFKAGETKVSINVSIVDDLLCEGNEVFYCDLIIPEATMNRGITAGSANEATTTILDDEDIVVNFAPTMYIVNEKDGLAILSLVLSCPAQADFQVTINTGDGTATDPDDYFGGEFTVTFSNGSTTAQVTIPVTNDMDGVDECDEDFNAQISIPEEAAANSVVAGPDNTANVVIKDDEPFFIDFVSPDTDVYESERVYQFCLTHNRTCPDPFSVPVINMQSGDDPADANDYRSGPYHVSFAEGEKTACAEIPVTEDNLDEPDEMFSLQIMPDPEGVPNIMPGPMAQTQVTIKSVDGDPMFIAPVSLPKRTVTTLLGQENTELAICYEVHGAENKIYNLVSDMCVSVNTHLTLASNPKVGNIMSRIGVMAMDNEGKCNQIEADLYQRTLVHNGQAVEGRKQHKGILLTKMRDRARISVPNCKGQSVVFWVIYHYHNGADMIKFTIADGHGLMPESHGLMGQFWNTPVEVIKLQKDKKLEAGDEFKVVVHSSFSGPRDFTGEYYPITWDLQRSPCLYAGSQNGSPVIEGRYTDYEVKSLFDPAFSYSQFTKDQCGKLPMPEKDTTNAHAL